MTGALDHVRAARGCVARAAHDISGEAPELDRADDHLAQAEAQLARDARRTFASETEENANEGQRAVAPAESLGAHSGAGDNGAQATAHPRPDVAALVAEARKFVAEDGSLVEASIPCPCTECESMRWILTLADALEAQPAFTVGDLMHASLGAIACAQCASIADKIRPRLPGATT